MTYYIAWQDGNPMRPASHRGRLVLFQDLDHARAGAGVLGVPACVRWARVVEVCRLHGLEVPDATIPTALPVA